jgi:outer membrane receptor protein involved in Fe transport
MLRRVFAFIIGLMLPFAAMAQNYSVSGTVKEKATGNAVDFATVALLSSEQWAVVDAKGNFEIKNVPAGENKLSVSCLGFVTVDKTLNVNGNIAGLVIELEEDNLRLESAVVTAKDNTNSATTSRTIDKAALEHIQVTNVASVTGLLPGGSTSTGSLTSLQTISLRGGGSFNTSIEVDGVRLSNNSSFSSTSGVTTNNIASANVESVEIITGVPSVEYGDMTAGVVKINTRKGRTPWQVTMTTSPSTKQVSLSKGFGLGTTKNGWSRGVINASAEYAKSISNKMSPYTSYDRK